jgi:PAP2 superfamily protein
MRIRLWVLVAQLFFAVTPALAGGPLGIDHKVEPDNDGIWLRPAQKVVLYTSVAAAVGGALWEGGETRLGKTLWQSIDATIGGTIAAEGMKRVFTRERPANTDDPNQWFKGGSNHSFPSGEVTTITAVITPLVLEYGREYPAVYALELLPLYDGISRVKTQSHWQSDVLAGFVLGTATGYLAHTLKQPLTLTVLPHGFAIGLKAKF